jgi:ElaB/YqjD/DUF883 family membrane-anchored ribosome-binding protein
MANESEPQMIRHQMEVQRASLSEKLDTLEHKIVETVQGARDAVAETVQNVRDSVQSSVETVKDTMQSSVDTVKEAFDLPRQVDRHPWAMFGGSVALGFAAGWLLNRAPPSRSAPWGNAPASYTGGGSSGHRPPAPRAEAPSFTAAPRPQAEKGPTWVDQLSETFQPEIHKLKGFAIGAALGVVRDMVAQAVPDQMRPQVNEMMDKVTTKLGGEPVQPDLLDQFIHDHNGRHRTPQEEFQS